MAPFFGARGALLDMFSSWMMICDVIDILSVLDHDFYFKFPALYDIEPQFTIFGSYKKQV